MKVCCVFHLCKTSVYGCVGLCATLQSHRGMQLTVNSEHIKSGFVVTGKFPQLAAAA